jgi:hypothetical protein
MSKPPPPHPYNKKIAIHWPIERESERGRVCVYTTGSLILPSLV